MNWTWVATFVCVLMLHLCTANENGNKLKLDSFRPVLDTVKVLDFEPSVFDFSKDFLYAGKPVLFKLRGKSWLEAIEKVGNVSFLKEQMHGFHGKAYKRAIWTSGWSTETRLEFSKFIDTLETNKLYWDSELPLTHDLTSHIPLPHFINTPPIHKLISASTVLFTNTNATSVFHHDGSENLFFQLKGTKDWLLANYTASEDAYADSYQDLQPGLSPINPEDIDIEKYPLIKNIQFYNVTTEPGDVLYVPEYWWHHVRSYGQPNIGFNIWMEVFNVPNLDHINKVAASAVQHAEFRAKEKMFEFPNQLQSVADVMQKPVKKSDTQHVTTDNLIYLGSDDGYFYAFNALDGTVVWKHKTSQDAGSTGVFNNDESNPIIYLAGEDAFVYAFEASTGEVLWKQQLGDAVTAPLRLDAEKQVLYISSLDMHAYALDVSNNGKIIWKSGLYAGELWAAPYIHEDGVIIAVKTNEETFKDKTPTVIMLDKVNGKEIWTYSTKSSIFATPAISEKDGLAYVASYDAYLHVIDIKTGKLVWKMDVKEPCDASPVFYDDKIIVTTLYGAVQCISIKGKSVVWEKELAENEESTTISTPLLVPGLNMLFSPVGNILYAVNVNNGKILWQFKAKDAFMASPRMDKAGVLYIGNSDNYLYAFNAVSGKLVWSTKTEGPVVASAVIPDKYAADMVGALL
uniref:uncharacterized protein LOC108949712 n=1 Tax=Ciona intestinalis TaxID=7719 RepID=UPI00089DAA03|nr:uncharacterized protein LOC108949712 [Ciona intestinalis]XP_026691272.1 uncharacterized protein LOC108949712 [Ciona intestinalis]|eukprot:XP_018668578.1 uncharacterized protein LOC108949712 [Ciona intestinalis]